jgi:hypothetical protein
LFELQRRAPREWDAELWGSAARWEISWAKEMGYWKRRLLGVSIPCLLALLLDAGLTTLGQSQEYWNGDYSAVNEGNPFFRGLFAIHPGAAIAGYVVWAGILIGLVLLLPEVLAVVLATAVVFGHVGGAYTWMQHFEWVEPFGQGWFQTAGGLLPAAAVVLGIGLSGPFQN